MLRGRPAAFLTPESVASSAQPPVPPSLDQVCEQALRLPCAPSLLPRLSAALQSDESSATEIERLISLDPSLASSTLRLANSAALGRGRVENLEEAVFRLGAKEIYRLAALALVSRWESGATRALRWDAGDFSRHALCTAIAADVLAEMTDRVDPQAAYTVGLVCEVGKLALAHSCGEFYAAVRTCCQQTQCTWEQAERTVFGYHHADASTRLLNAWNFPHTLALVAEYQLQPTKAPAEALPMLATLHAAKYLATALGPGTMEESFLVAVQGPFLEEWGFNTELLDRAMPDLLDRASARLGEQLTHGKIRL